MAVKAADFNHDGFLDLAVANFNESTTSILLGNGNGSFTPHVNLSNGPHAGTNGIAIGDINKDNHSDIVVVNRVAGNVGVFLGLGNGDFSNQTTFSTGAGSSPVGLALGDLNDDTALDLVITDHVNGSLLIFLGTNNGTWFVESLRLPTSPDGGPYLVLIADFNRDHQPDIAVGNGDGNYLAVFLGDGRGGFSVQKRHPIASGPYALVATDFNRDGILDVVTANYDASTTSILFGNGDGTFREPNSFSTGNGSLPYAIGLGDLNRDNVQDLIVPNSGTDNVGVLLGYSNGKFRSPKTYSTGSGCGPVEIAIGDFNGDHRLNFVSANAGHGTIGIFLSTCS